ncbi:hypothetical protein K1T71_005540 [Dendrolimus kikuchii]|uniref:Uncharacterized protein n=1 Tax=Dendrolimus kikuchii TaxID=765133 RepID=A0ACC1D4M8_9NEOP|nr:hypothetical protein K1T71_005540 [Dendrolimus kikuchii]
MNINSVLKIKRLPNLMKRLMCTPPAAGPSSTPNSASGSLQQRYRPSNFQKTILVWTKKYKSKEEIPQFVSAELIERSRSEARIKISNILIALTALASFGAILAGKAAAKRGESVHQMNLDWHKQYEEEQKKKEAVEITK